MSTISDVRTALPTGTWTLDPVHSSVGFSVKHMIVANFRGGFDTFDVTLDEQGLRGTVDVATISVSEPNLHGHLLSPDFFDAERHPQVSFWSRSVRSRARRSRSTANSMHGTTRPVRDHGPSLRPGQGSWTATRGTGSSSPRRSTAPSSASTGTPACRGWLAVANDVTLNAELEFAGAAA